MGYLVLTTVKDLKYYFFKKEKDSVTVFSDDEAPRIVRLMEEKPNTFKDTAVLHRGHQEVRNVDAGAAAAAVLHALSYGLAATHAAVQ